MLNLPYSDSQIVLSSVHYREYDSVQVYFLSIILCSAKVWEIEPRKSFLQAGGAWSAKGIVHRDLPQKLSQEFSLILVCDLKSTQVSSQRKWVHIRVFVFVTEI